MTTPERLAEPALHRAGLSTEGEICAHCRQKWPCEVATLTRSLEEAALDRDSLKKVIASNQTEFGKQERAYLDLQRKLDKALVDVTHLVGWKQRAEQAEADRDRALSQLADLRTEIGEKDKTIARIRTEEIKPLNEQYDRAREQLEGMCVALGLDAADKDLFNHFTNRMREWRETKEQVTTLEARVKWLEEGKRFIPTPESYRDFVRVMMSTDGKHSEASLRTLAEADDIEKWLAAEPAKDTEGA